MLLPVEKKGMMCFSIKGLHFVGWLAFAVLFCWFYAGFYFVDPRFFSGASSSGLKLVLWTVRILVPLVALSLVCLFYLLRIGRISILPVVLGAVGVSLALFVCYVISSDYYYGSSSALKIADYHPYLQLSPPEIKLKESDPKKKKPYRIFFIGGSSTAWPDSKGVDWPSMVGSEMQKLLPESNIETYNAAREWYNTEHALINFLSNIKQMHPDAIVVMHAVNDLLINADFSWLSAGSFREDYGHFLGPLARLMKRKSFFGMLKEKASASWYHKARNRLTTDKFPGLVSFERNLRQLVTLAKTEPSAQVVLMTEPYLYKETMSEEELQSLTMLRFFSIGEREEWTLETALSGMRQYSEMIRKLSKNEQVGLIDLEMQIPKTAEYLRDDVHYTDKAFPLIASSVSSGLAGYLFPGS